MIDPELIAILDRISVLPEEEGTNDLYGQIDHWIDVAIDADGYVGPDSPYRLPVAITALKILYHFAQTHPAEVMESLDFLDNTVEVGEEESGYIPPCLRSLAGIVAPQQGVGSQLS